ncbi:TetR/AcrR family transcriptional regulator [Citricoccus nitrophenolicus]|uniref:TetR/AcrR family transcriptional regulator n=1 Tax=Citricoccus nitrophenolicus TaxID=863575 RepID=A0ABV0IH12_9MICC
MTATWRATQKANRRAALMESAARLFAERGFAAVSTAELGEAVGMSGPALYKHFPSKDALLAEILVDASERLLDGCRAILAEDSPEDSPEEARGGAADTLRRLIRFHLEFATTDPDVIRIQDRELPALAPEDNQEVRRLQREYVQLWDGVLARLDPAMRDGERQVRLLGTFGLLNSTPHSAPVSTGDPAGVILAGMAYRSLTGGTSPAVAAAAGSAA